MAALSLVPSLAPAEKSWAAAASQGPVEPLDMADFWRDLMAGRHRCVEFTGTNAYFIAMFEARERSEPVSGAAADITQRVLLGESTKAVAIDLNRSPSAVILTIKKALEGSGFERFSPLPAMAAHAAKDREITAQIVRFDEGGSAGFVLRVARPDAVFFPMVSQAEREVMRLLLEGASLQIISMQRGTSIRTVANQLASLYRRLGVSGRVELMAMAIQRWAPLRASTPLSPAQRLSRIEERLGLTSGAALGPSVEERLTRIEEKLDKLIEALGTQEE